MLHVFIYSVEVAFRVFMLLFYSVVFLIFLAGLMLWAYFEHMFRNKQQTNLNKQKTNIQSTSSIEYN